MVNTVTLYRSPVRLVKHASEDAENYSSQSINRARKKMMAEIALAGDEVVIEDVAYSRNDASTLLDVITEESWKTHSTIYLHKGLLNFLEKEEFNDEELKKADAWLYNERFVKVVSPYFAHSFNTVSGRLLRENNFAELVKLLNYKGYILPEHSHEAYQKIRNYIDELNYTLKNLSWEKFFEDESILHFIFTDGWKPFINHLPSMFTSLRDELVEHMIGIVLRFQHKATWYYLHQVLVQLKTIETNEFNSSEVERIDAIIYENSRIEGGKGRISKSKDGVSGRNVWWTIWIILLIVRVATCSNRDSKQSPVYNNDYQQYQERQRLQNVRIDERRNESLLFHFMDSLSSKPFLGVRTLPEEMKTGAPAFSSFADEFPNTGSDTVHLTNNSGYNCVAMYIKAGGLTGSVYEGALPHIAAVYIQNGGTFTFNYTPGSGKFHFVFGEKWGKLKEQTELKVYSERGYSGLTGRQHVVFLYEFFSNKIPVKQNYLQQAVYLQKASSDRNESKYNYLNNPYEVALNQATELNLLKSNGRFTIEAKGSLLVKEVKQAEKQSFANIIESSGVKKQLKQ